MIGVKVSPGLKIGNIWLAHLVETLAQKMGEPNSLVMITTEKISELVEENIYKRTPMAFQFSKSLQGQQDCMAYRGLVVDGQHQRVIPQLNFLRVRKNLLVEALY